MRRCHRRGLDACRLTCDGFPDPTGTWGASALTCEEVCTDAPSTPRSCSVPERDAVLSLARDDTASCGSLYCRRCDAGSECVGFGEITAAPDGHIRCYFPGVVGSSLAIEGRLAGDRIVEGRFAYHAGTITVPSCFSRDGTYAPFERLR